MTLKVLLVEDDRDLRTMLRQALTLEGCEVLPAASLADAQALMAHAGTERPIEIALLDLGLPDGTGESLLGPLKLQPGTPVIVITAQQTEERKIRLLDAGADDYLVKPFSIGELLARMRVALRHRGTVMRSAITQYTAGELQIDVDARRVRRGDADVHLTPTEFKLLARLVRSAGQVVTQRQLLAAVWGNEHVDHTHYLRLYMGQLRAKLEANPANPRYLVTEPGVGYRLADPGD
jgi:two-component system KDP operon response regulator KdpE